MIHYRKGLGGLYILCKLEGTSWPYGVIPGLIAMAISLGLSFIKEADEHIRERSEFISHPYAFQLFAYLLGFLMVFRTNFAYQRYWEAIGAMQNMAAKWLDGALMGIAFDAGGRVDRPLLYGAQDKDSSQPNDPKNKGGPSHSDFYGEIVHLCSLLHALALQHLRQDSNLDNLELAYPDAGAIPISQKMVTFGMPVFSLAKVGDTLARQKLPVLGGLRPEERAVLEMDSQQQVLPTDARVAMVEGWFMRRLIARQKFEQGESAYTSPPILSRLYQVISDGTLWYGAASKVAITPFPFPYHNLISVFLWMYTFLAPVLINGIIMDVALRAVFVFVSVFCYHALNNIGDNLEDPYLPYDPNELPLPALQHSVNMRLFAFGVVPAAPAEGDLS
eukprot:TRINITY_DN23371_c0_g1_i1.p1 TRINITY_DN23371_c0_g1~~TRINITY_DN23371_c0_g1_i1.p1  ORF type:complete len:390 (+),score=55.54 TRINITY_DN23371_c0_g1_i1:119-1288(+)